MQLDNLQTRMLSGHRGVPFGGISDQHLEIALRNMRDFRFVGVHHELERSIDRLGEVLGCTLRAAPSVNVHSPRSPVEPGEAERLAELNWADRVLLSEAAGMLTEPG